MMDNKDFEHIMIALFKCAQPTIGMGTKGFMVDLQDVVDILKGFVIHPPEVIFDYENREMRIEGRKGKE